jgi:hypothetical protein
MIRFAVWAAMALALAMGSRASAGDLQTVSDFKRLCMDTHAEPAKVFAAADAAGWKPSPEQNDHFRGLSGNPDGRVIDRGSPAFRAVTASSTINGRLVRRECFLLAVGDVAAVRAAVRDLLKVDPASQSDTATIWNVIEIDGVIIPIPHDRPPGLAKAKHVSAMMQVLIQRLDGSSLVMRYLEVDDAPAAH